MTAYVIAGSGTLRDIGNAAIWGVATARTGERITAPSTSYIVQNEPGKVEPTEAPTRNLKSNPRILWR